MKPALGALLLATALSAACASTATVSRPSPFPGAPSPAWPVGTNVGTAPSAAADSVVQMALGMRGVRYRLGGAEPAGGFDCSGLVRYVYDQHQIGMPRTVTEQYRVGRRINPRDARVGDLLFFSTIGRGATHVGIVIGPGEFVHAPGTGEVVRLERYDTPYWRDRLVGVRRPL